MMFPLVRDLAADGIPVAVTCRVLGFSRQAFYKWNTDPVSRRDWDDAHLINAALDIHAGDPEFGYRFIADELPAHGIVAGENRVHRLCSQQRIFSVFAKKRGLHRRSGPPVHDDLVRRQFTAQQPDRLWLTDITEHWTDEGKLYLCSCAWRSSSGSNAPTTAGVGNDASAASHPSSLKCSTSPPQSPPEPHTPRVNRSRGSPVYSMR